MSHYSYKTAKTQVPGSTKHTHYRCPACGELKCLCRPRFFPGQLLTEEDLNRLDRYIVEKNKLHISVENIVPVIPINCVIKAI